MTRLRYFDSPRPRVRLLAGVIAQAASQLPPPALRWIVRPLRWMSRRRRPRFLVSAADRLVDLLVGDGCALRVRQQFERRAR